MIGRPARGGPNRDFVGARVVDPSLGLDAIRTVIVRSGSIAALLDGAPAAPDASVERIDCTGMVLCPGFVDPHVHLRVPGDAHKETLETGLRAAAAGGFTAVAAMPNTRPAIDEPARVERLLADAAAVGAARCHAIGAVSIGREGVALAPLRGMAAAGAVAFSDDGTTTASLKVLYHAAKLIADLPHVIMSHCDDLSFADAVMAEGPLSDRLGVPGTPALAEAAVMARDLLVARATGRRWHVCHVSTRDSLDVLRWARSLGVRVTAEVTPHHLHFTDAMLEDYDARWRVNPPLRSADDVAALRAAVASGDITIFASDHAPHHADEKELPLAHACAGFSGLEIAVGAYFDALPDLALPAMIERLSTNPAKMLGVRGGTLAVGAPADITGLYLSRPWRVEPSRFYSRGEVTPFAGRTFAVKPALTVVGGDIVSREGVLNGALERKTAPVARLIVEPPRPPASRPLG